MNYLNWYLGKIFPKFRLNNQILFRMIADVIIVSMSLLGALIGRFFYEFIRWNAGDRAANSTTLYVVFSKSLELFLYSSPVLVVISLLMFWASGFYTKGRGYRGRYKVLIIFHAVTISYLLFISALYIVPLLPKMPRSVLLVAWVLTILVIFFARFVTLIFRKTGLAEVSRENRIKKRSIDNVLVIGGAGYIGSMLCRKLLQMGYNVRVFDALLFGDKSIKKLYKEPNFELLQGDFRNIGDLVNAMVNIDAVIHLGAIVGDPACALDDKVTLEINLLATRMICEVAKGYGVNRLLFASTCSVYGASDNLLTEQSSLNPVSLYAVSKIGSEKIILEMADHNFHPTIFRLATVFGLSYRPRFDLVVNVLAAKAFEENEIKIYGGDQWRPFVHVENVAEAFVKALSKPIEAIHGRTFNIGSDENNYQIEALGPIVENIFPSVRVHYDLGSPDKRNYKVSFEKFFNEFGLNGFKGPDYGVREIKRALERGLVGDYKNPHYNNYHFLSDDLNFGKLKGVTSLTHIQELYNGDNGNGHEI